LVPGESADEGEERRKQDVATAHHPATARRPAALLPRRALLLCGGSRGVSHDCTDTDAERSSIFVVMTTLAVNEVHRQNEVIKTKITSLVAFGGSSNYTNGSLVWSAVGKTFALRLKSRDVLRKPRNPSGEPCANELGSEFTISTLFSHNHRCNLNPLRPFTATHIKNAT
jgi:hypothetical protein